MTVVKVSSLMSTNALISKCTLWLSWWTALETSVAFCVDGYTSLMFSKVYPCHPKVNVQPIDNFISSESWACLSEWVFTEWDAWSDRIAWPGPSC